MDSGSSDENRWEGWEEGILEMLHNPRVGDVFVVAPGCDAIKLEVTDVGDSITFVRSKISVCFASKGFDPQSLQFPPGRQSSMTPEEWANSLYGYDRNVLKFYQRAS